MLLLIESLSFVLLMFALADCYSKMLRDDETPSR